MEANTNKGLGLTGQLAKAKQGVPSKSERPRWPALKE